MDKFTMSRKENKQIPVFEKLVRGEISQKAAAKMLGITDRQVRNKWKQYRAKGAEGLVHRGRGRASSLKWDKTEKEYAMSLLKGDFKGFGPTFAAEKLEELHSITISKETLRKAMIAGGIWSCKKRKPVYRSRRPRKLNFGQMTQIDGSPHDWFEGRAPRCTLLVFIDDATSKIVWLRFAKSESTESLMRAAKDFIRAYGRPVSIYVDYGSVFSVNTNNPERDKITQFERSMKELGVEVKHARSPQAKGRVERVNRTLQDRLIKEMRLAGISSIDEANRFIQEKYLSVHNKKFAVDPELEQDLHRTADGFDLDNIFCRKEERVLQNDFIISYKKRLLQLHKDQKTIVRPKNTITVHESLDGAISLHIRETKLYFSEVSVRPIKPSPRKKAPRTPRLWKPAPDHPWRHYGAETQSTNNRKDTN